MALLEQITDLWHTPATHSSFPIHAMKLPGILFAVALAVCTCHATAQSPGGAGTRRERGEARSPEKIAEHMMAKFDANKDGELSQDELTKAVEEMRAHRPQGQPGEGAGHPTPPPPDKAAERMIAKYASDKKGVTTSELAKAITEHRQHRGAPGAGRSGAAGSN
jgi:hypothetical protein